MTSHVKCIALESKVLEEKNIASSLESYTSMISHEFRTPLATSMMFLKNILRLVFDKHITEMLSLVMNQIYLLISLVDDIVDIKLIQEGKFSKKLEIFNPTQVFNLAVQTMDVQAMSRRVSARSCSSPPAVL